MQKEKRISKINYLSNMFNEIPEGDKNYPQGKVKSMFLLGST